MNIRMHRGIFSHTSYVKSDPMVGTGDVQQGTDADKRCAQATRTREEDKRQGRDMRTIDEEDKKRGQDLRTRDADTCEMGLFVSYVSVNVCRGNRSH